MTPQPPARIAAVLALLVAGPAAVAQAPAFAGRTQVRFVGPSGMQVRWYARTADGRAGYSEPPLVVPGRYNFRQGAVYRLKLSRIPGRPGLELYPTLEVPLPAGPDAQAFLAHSAVRLELTGDDFRQVAEGGYLAKTVYLPGSGGRGNPLLVLRLGGVDLEAP